MFAEAFAARQQALIMRKDPRVTELAEEYRHSGYNGYLLKQAEFEQPDRQHYMQRTVMRCLTMNLAPLPPCRQHTTNTMSASRSCVPPPNSTPFVHRPVSATWSAASGFRHRQATRTESKFNTDRALCHSPNRCNGACPLVNFSVTALGVSVRALGVDNLSGRTTHLRSAEHLTYRAALLDRARNA